MITALFRYHSIQNLTMKMNTDRKLSHHIFIHPNSAMTPHFFRPLTKAVLVFIFSLSMLYTKACLHIGQNNVIHTMKSMTMAMISRVMLNLCIAFTKYIRALDISIQELYCRLANQFIKYMIQ